MGKRVLGSPSAMIPHSYGASFSGVGRWGENILETMSDAPTNTVASTSITATGR